MSKASKISKLSKMSTIFDVSKYLKYLRYLRYLRCLRYLLNLRDQCCLRCVKDDTVFQAFTALFGNKNNSGSVFVRGFVTYVRSFSNTPAILGHPLLSLTLKWLNRFKNVSQNA